MKVRRRASQKKVLRNIRVFGHSLKEGGGKGGKGMSSETFTGEKGGGGITLIKGGAFYSPEKWGECECNQRKKNPKDPPASQSPKVGKEKVPIPLGGEGGGGAIIAGGNKSTKTLFFFFKKKRRKKEKNPRSLTEKKFVFATATDSNKSV